MTRKIDPMNFFIIPELKPEVTIAMLKAKWPKATAEQIVSERERGIRHEMEHTPFRYIARIITSHHLVEDLLYYHKLERWHK